MNRENRDTKVTFRLSPGEVRRYTHCMAFYNCHSWSRLVREALIRMEAAMTRKLNAPPQSHLKPAKKVTRYNARRKALTA